MGTTENEAPLHIPTKFLNTHVMIQAPTGAGKTFLARALFRELAQRDVAIVVDDPKHDLLDALAEDCAALNLDARTTVFDTSRPALCPVFNPLRKMSASAEQQALWLLGAVRACFRQDNWDLTPQRPRWMYNALVPIIECGGSFSDVLDLLNFQKTGTRRGLLAETTNQLVIDEWRGFEDLSPTRRRDETYSAFAWLLKFCLTDDFKRIVHPQEHTFDPGDLLTNSGILLQSFPRYKPLDVDSVNFLRSLSLNTILMEAFRIPLGERPPVYIILDEAEHALNRNPEVISTILREGRGLGIHLILLFHEFAEVGAHDPSLIETVLNGCRTKFIGGHLNQSNLEVLTAELFTAAWHPHIVRDEITGLEVEPVETTRTHESVSQTRMQGWGLSLPENSTEGVSESTSDGHRTQRSRSQSTGQSDTVSFGKNTAYSQAVHESRAFAQTRGWAQAHADGATETAGSGQSRSYPMVAGMPVFTSGNVTPQTSRSGSTSASDVSSETGSTAETETTGTTATVGQQASENHGQGNSYGTQVSEGEAENHVTTNTTNRAASKGKTPSWNESTSTSKNTATVSFHELKKRRVVVSRQFLALADFLTVMLIKIKKMPQQYWVAAAPQGDPVFFKARFIEPLRGGLKRLPEFYSTITSRLYYTYVALPQASTEPIVVDLFPEDYTEIDEDRLSQ